MGTAGRGAPVKKLEVPGVRLLIAVASGKGGVGKSTVAANLALALTARGLRVGLLDADIYGPSQGLLFGIPDGTRPDVKDNMMVPVSAAGVALMSMAFLTSANTPAVWRGPMASGALQQMLSQTAWGDLDCLLIDMPPGTGDIQLTLAQQAPVDGVVIVTTPQDIALLDARKGIEMFRKVAVPVLGVVENMSTHVCSECGHEEPIFGSGGGARIAAEYDTPLLGQLPLSMGLRLQADGGPSPLAGGDDGVSSQFHSLAAALWHEVEALAPLAGPAISVVED